MNAFLAENFFAPPREYQAVYAWPWNSAITQEVICRELDEMLQMGIRSVYIIPMPMDFRPQGLRARLEPGYLTDAFFRLVRFAAQEARKRDMDFWLYDEGGWPSGGARNLLVSQDTGRMRTVLERRDALLRAGTVYRPADDVIAAFAEGGPIAPGHRAETDTKIQEYYREYQAFGGLTQALDAQNTRAFLSETHEKYARALSGVAQNGLNFFTDEPGAGGRPWPQDMAERFEKRYGYSILGYLPAVYDGALAASAADVRARIDYYSLCGELFRQNFLEPIRDWCRGHGMVLCGHLNNEDNAFGALHCGYGSTLASLRRLDLPGIDLIWRQLVSPDMQAQPQAAGFRFFPRIGASAARQIGQTRCLSESFNIYGAGFTWNQARYLANFQFVRGITLINNMNVPSGRQRATPLNMRPCYTPEIPGPEHMQALNGYLARAQFLLQTGIPASDTALYSPDRDYLADDATARAAEAAFRAAGEALEQAGVDFDYIDDEAILAAELSQGALNVGNACYRHVVVPPCKHMPEEVRAKLIQVDQRPGAPTLLSGPEFLRARRLHLPKNSGLMMVFNEGAASWEGDFSFECPGPLRELDCLHGEILSPDYCQEGRCVRIHTHLASGEARFYLWGPQLPPVSLPRMREIARFTPGPMKARRERAYCIDDFGITSKALEEAFAPMAPGPWAESFGGDFSGEACYKCTFTPEVPVREGDFFLLTLGEVRYSARVTVNGKEAGLAAMRPYQVRFPAEEGPITVEIHVANTPANEILATDSFTRWPQAEIGTYHEKTLLFEKESLDGGLYGPVALTLLRPEEA